MAPKRENQYSSRGKGQKRLMETESVQSNDAVEVEGEIPIYIIYNVDVNIQKN